MIGKQGRAAIAATLLCTLLVPAVSSVAGPKSRLQQIEAERDALQNRIEAGEADARTLKGRIKALGEQLTEIQKEIVRLDERIAQVASEVRTAQAAVDATQESIDRIEAVATRQAVELYKAGATDAIEALLNSDSLTELDARAELLGAAAQENTSALVRYGRLRVEIKAQHRELFNKKEELSAELKSRSIAKAKMDKARSELNADLATLNDKLGSQRVREGNLQDASDRLRGNLEAIQARNQVEALGTSAQGFIWPLNGPITSPYGPRWGRMHEGIDIDGYTGQPIVASKGGTVVIAEYYGGYGYAVAIDHGGGIATFYAHNNELAVSPGQRVDRGDLIAYVGNTGNSYGDHLHFEVRVNGDPQDPMYYLP